MREDTRSPIWGGATIGLLVGVILGFFVGTYWTTVLYAVLIGAAAGVAANLLALLGRVIVRRDASGRPVYRELTDDERRERLQRAEGILRDHRPTDVTELHESVGVVGWVEEEELWRPEYDSIDSFYRAHQGQHPDIRLYATVENAIPHAHDGFPLDERAGVVAQRIAALRGATQS